MTSKTYTGRIEKGHWGKTGDRLSTRQPRVGFGYTLKKSSMSTSKTLASS